MKNDFQKWHNLKERLDKKTNKIYFREKEIWWCSLGLNIGYEQDGKNNNFERPIIILKKFNPDILLLAPLTSKNKIGKYYYQFDHNEKKYSIILSQLRLISSKRLLRRIKTLQIKDFLRIKEIIKSFL